MLPLDCILNYINYFDIYMLTNYALTYKYGFECIQKHIHNKKIMNDRRKIKPTIRNSLVRLRGKYMNYDSNNIARIVKIVKVKEVELKETSSGPSTDSFKCYFIVISNPRLCGDKHYIYPEWKDLKTLEFDHDDYIPYI